MNEERSQSEEGKASELKQPRKKMGKPETGQGMAEAGQRHFFFFGVPPTAVMTTAELTARVFKMALA